MNWRAFLPYLAFLLTLLPTAEALAAQDVSFGQFAAQLPPGWDGAESRGFISDDEREYLLTFTRRDESGDAIAAQVSIYLLPNKPGASAREAAQKLAEAQADSSQPAQCGPLWSFEGEPRTRAAQGRATTWVNADADFLLIIIAQDQHKLGARELVESLRGLSPEAARLLGR